MQKTQSNALELRIVLDPLVSHTSRNRARRPREKIAYISHLNSASWRPWTCQIGISRNSTPSQVRGSETLASHSATRRFLILSRVAHWQSSAENEEAWIAWRESIYKIHAVLF